MSVWVEQAKGIRSGSFIRVRVIHLGRGPEVVFRYGRARGEKGLYM
jgi:hypothetical protein